MPPQSSCGKARSPASSLRRAAAAAVVRDPERGVLLIYRHRFITDSWGWEVPAGGVDPGETPEQAAVLARHAVRQRPLGWSGILATLGQGWPMVSASFIPLATLLLAGALGESVFIAINLSLAVATALLVGAGWSASRASGLAGWRLLVSTAVSAVFGLTMVALKNLLHA